MERNNVGKLAIAATALAVVAVVAINLLPAGDGPGSGDATVSPSPSLTLRPSPSLTTAVPFPVAGELEIGRHPVTIDGVAFSFEVPTSGWFSTPGRTGGFIQRGADNATTPVWMLFWSLVNVYADPCTHTLLSPPVGPTAADLAAALLTIPGTDATGPTDVTIGGLAAKHVVLTVREDVGCDAENFYLWAAVGDSARYASQLPTTIRVWIVDVDGERIVIESELLQGGTAELDQEIDQIVDSIRFE
jgi:hypothetical protein